MKWTPKTVAITAGVVVIGAWYIKRKAGKAITEAGQAVNPVNRENIFNRAFNGVYGAVTGSEQPAGTDLGQWASHNDRWWTE